MESTSLLLTKHSFRQLTRALFLGLGLVVSIPAYPYSLVLNESEYFSAWTNPTTTIDFSHLKDGKDFTNAFGASPLVSYKVGNILVVLQDGWSNQVLIGSTVPGCQCAWTATAWDGSTISPENYNRIYINFGSNETPFTVNGGDAFLGFSPTGSNLGGYTDGLQVTPLLHSSSGYLVLPVGFQVTSLSFGYSAVPAPAAVPVPAAAWLLGSGLLGLIGVARKNSAQ